MLSESQGSRVFSHMWKLERKGKRGSHENRWETSRVKGGGSGEGRRGGQGAMVGNRTDQSMSGAGRNKP